MAESPKLEAQANGEPDVEIQDSSSTPSKAPTSPALSDDSEKEKTDEPTPEVTNGTSTRPESALSDSARHATKRPRDDEDAEAPPVKTKQTKATESSDDEVPATTKKMEETKVTEAPQEHKFKSSGFASFATTSSSPFGAGSGTLSSFASPKKPTSSFATKPEAGNDTKTAASTEDKSTSAFSKSGFSAFASVKASPFGGAASSTLSSFASPSSSSIAAPSSSDNKSTSKPSVFGSASSSGFASLGGSSTLGGTSIFAKPGVTGITGLSDKPAKPFGAPGETKKDEDDDTKEESESSTPAAPITTGEEDETVAWSGRAKIFVLEGEKDKKAWKERGVGVMKLNVKEDDDGTRKLRLVLRVDGTLRVALNVGITKAMKFGTIEGNCPTDGKIMFSVPLKEDEIASYTLRMRVPAAEELWKSVKKLQDEFLVDNSRHVESIAAPTKDFTGRKRGKSFVIQRELPPSVACARVEKVEKVDEVLEVEPLSQSEGSAEEPSDDQQNDQETYDTEAEMTEVEDDAFAFSQDPNASPTYDSDDDDE